MIQDRIDKVHKPREIEVLFWLLECSSTGQQRALLATSIGQIKDNIVIQRMADKGALCPYRAYCKEVQGDSKEMMAKQCGRKFITQETFEKECK